MFGWGQGNKKDKAPDAMPEIGRNTDLEDLMTRDLVVLFKHSHACPVSWAAHTQMSRFVLKHPDITVYLIPVIRERDFSRALANRIDVRHESPQVIVLRHGVVSSVASHGDITEFELDQMLAAG